MARKGAQRMWLISALVLCTPAWALTAKDSKTDPKPNIEPDLSPLTLTLSIAESIPEEVESKTKGIAKLKVEAWRTALQRGFDNGFSDAHGATSFTIEISRADVSLVPAAVNGAGSVVGIMAQVTYKARLADSSGQTACSAASTVSAKQAATTASAVSGLVASAIESLYEDLANTCLAALPSPAPAPPSPAPAAPAPAAPAPEAAAPQAPPAP